MQTNTQIKEVVREKYASIADSTDASTSCCDRSTCCDAGPTDLMADSYLNLEGYNPEADLHLGCGLPTEFAQIKKGNTVIDLGSGAGNDCFVAQALTGPTGKVLGVDFTPSMISKARANAEKLQLNNVEFRLGDIEDMPVSGDYADVVISNCVLNLAPNKERVFSEIHRVLKAGGHFSISDIVLEGELDVKWREVAELYAGCISGASDKSSYLNMIKEAGFSNITVQKEKVIQIPDEVLEKHLTAEDIQTFKNSGARIKSITVYAEKGPDSEKVCGPEKCTCC